MQRFALILIATAGCAEPAPIARQDVGRACAHQCTTGDDNCWNRDVGDPTGGVQRLEAGSRIGFFVEVDHCSGQCLDNIEASCHVATSSDTLWITSQFSASPHDGPCARECKPVHVACTTGTLRAATYRIQYGELASTLEIPGEYAEAPCLGSWR